LRKAARFLRTIRASRSALDWELHVALPHGVTSLFFSGCQTNDGLVIVGTKDALSVAAIPRQLLAAAEEAPTNLGQALLEIGARREAKVQAERTLKHQLAQLKQALAHGQSGPAESGAPRGKAGSKQVRLLEMAAHDLRNPISGVLAASQFLVEDAAGRLEEHHLALLRSIESSSRLMLRLLDDMVEIPAIDSKKLRMHFQPTDLRALVEQAVSVIRPMADHRRVPVEIKVDGGVPVMAADPVRMSEALHGLLASAVRWSRSGGRVEVMIGVRRDQAVVSVTNADPESSVEEMKRMLLPVDLGRLKGGLPEARTALTLASVKRTVEAHRGTIHVDTEADRGPTLTLTLPIGHARGGGVQVARRHRAHSGG
jgi:signal transduction histidine kinase